jgi:hypothetical protein
MNRHAIIKAGQVTNVVLWDGDKSKWTPHTDETSIQIPADSLVSTGYSYANGIFTAPPAVAPVVTLAEAKTAKFKELAGYCRIALENGFESSALGTIHTYPSTETDQHNLQSIILAGIESPLWCAEDGTWSFKDHTIAQVQQVNVDWLNYRITQQRKYATSMAIVNSTATTTVEAVTAVIW